MAKNRFKKPDGKGSAPKAKAKAKKGRYAADAAAEAAAAEAMPPEAAGGPPGGPPMAAAAGPPMSPGARMKGRYGAPSPEEEGM